MNRRTLLAVAALSLTAGAALAQTWPSKPITIVNGYPAGGDSDAMARLYAEKLTARFGQQVIVDNKPGASGTIAASAVAKAAPDGYTLIFVPSTFAIAQLTLKPSPNTAHDVVRDFTPIIRTANVPLMAVAAPGTHKDMKAVIDAAKSGKTLTYGTPGAGSPMHILGEMLNRDAGIRLTHVPYRGVAPVVTDAMGGHVAVGWVTPPAVAGHLEGRKLVPLAIADRQRSKLFPNVQTLVELGYKDAEITAWHGLLGPKGLPADVAAKLNAAMNDVLRMPDVLQKMQALGYDVVGGEPAALSSVIAADQERFGKVIKEFGISAE
jgi:tripartite-type tricarboxylate transporter receptor subunit TctC